MHSRPVRVTGRAWAGLSAAAVAVLVTGCSATVGPGDPARGAAEAFYAAVGQGDGAAACALLAPEAVATLEQSAQEPCATALPGEQLPAAQVRRVQVFGQSAFVELDGDTAFLGRFPDGWRVTAAGCRERPARPYDCQVEVG
jgi:hypothetical protein